MYELYKIRLIAELEKLIKRAEPMFRRMTTLTEVSEGLNTLHIAHEKGIDIIRRSEAYKAFTEEERGNILYTFDLYFTDVFDIALNQRIYIENHKRA